MLYRSLCFALLFTLACGNSSDSSSTTDNDTASGTGNGGGESGESCSLGRSDGCCPGDGVCCPCVLGCDPDKAFQQDPLTDALIECVCATEACQEVCANECAGNGINACEECVQQVGMDVCMDELLACGGPADDNDG